MTRRFPYWLIALLMVIGVGFAAPSATAATAPWKPRPAVVTVTAGPSALPDGRTSLTIAGLDLHDAQLYQSGGLYYMVGTMYGCGYEWYIAGTPWCGFGVSTAASLAGPWTTPQLLFSPSSVDPSTGYTWQQICGTQTGQGCFNPRFVQRTGWGYDDGVWILWFNAPRQYSLGAAHAYNVMGCNGPAGPCGPTAGAPSGSYNKPSLDLCAGANGDFGMISSGQGGRPAVVCTKAGAASLALQELNWSGSGGSAGVGVSAVAGLTKVEGPGGWWDAEAGRYVLTFSDPGCGYCAGSPAGYATAPSMLTGWSYPANVGWGYPANGRRLFSPNSCGGQVRTVSVLDGKPWQVLDLWLGTRNETAAKTLLVPLAYTETPGTAGDGNVWRPPLTLEC